MTEPYRPDSNSPGRDPRRVAMVFVRDAESEAERIRDVIAYFNRTWDRRVEPGNFAAAVGRLRGNTSPEVQGKYRPQPSTEVQGKAKPRQLTLADRLEALASKEAA